MSCGELRGERTRRMGLGFPFPVCRLGLRGIFWFPCDCGGIDEDEKWGRLEGFITLDLFVELLCCVVFLVCKKRFWWGRVLIYVRKHRQLMITYCRLL